MKKINLLILIGLLSVGSITNAKTIYLMSMDEDKQDEAIEVTVEDKRTFYRYCEVEIVNKQPGFDCEDLGDPRGYSQDDLVETDKQLDFKNKLEFATDALILATAVLEYRHAVKKMQARQGFRLFTRGVGSKQITHHLNFLKRDILMKRATFLALGISAKTVFLDTADEEKENLKQVNASADEASNESMIFLEDFDVIESADLLSRALN